MTKRYNRFFIVLMVLALGLLPALAAPKAPKPVNLKGFSEFVTKTMAEWKVPGMAVAIVNDGKVIFAEGFGLRDVKHALKVTPHTLFPIGSCSKAFTAAGVGILVDEGKVGWDEPVRTYLPDFKLQDEYASAHATLRDLLSHRTGLPRHDLLWFSGQFSRRELYDRLRYLEMNKEFRSTWQYQNLMFMTAGYLVGQVCGSSWENVIQKRILDPLGMKETNFSVALTQKSADFSQPYAEITDKVEQVPYRDITAVGPAGSINSNVLDLAQWVLLNLNKGKFGDKQIVSEASMGQIHSPQMLIPSPIQYDEVLYLSYGMGWVIEPYRGHLLVWHNGGIDGFISQIAFLPRENAGLVILSNLNDTSLPPIISNNIVDRLLGLDEVDWNKRTKDAMAKAKAEEDKAKKEGDKDRKLNTVPSHPLADYAGDYENPAYGTFSVLVDGEGLKMKTPGLEGPLSHYHYDVFELKAMILGTELKSKVAFASDLKGNIASLSVQLEPSVKDIAFTRAADKGMMEKEFLEKFVGTYVLSGAEVKVSLREGKGLILSVPGQPDYELVPYRGTEFKLKGVEGYSVEFKQDAGGAVTEALVHQPNGTFPAKKK
ncbi:MAG TPA: serine hydrolase [Candidatus Bathyarchaeia archaeon]|nr:serine hydrolase [Candidatus Bathyarchaeia archaeon]